jgi:uncharacterized protein YjbJ (UPF0337 family)
MRKLRAIAFAAALAVPAFAVAQDQGPGPDEVKQKILEIERLMKGAEEALARSTDTRSAADKAAEAARKILEQKAKQETGKSCDDLRKEAEGGSKEAKETLERLTKAANEEAKKAAEKMSEVLDGGSGGSGGAGHGIRELIEKIKGDGQGASAGIKWLLEKSTQQKGGQSPPKDGKGDHEKKPNAPDPKKPEEKKPEEKPKDDNKRPESKKEPPRNPDFEQWIAELPPQVRKAYETEDWDSIPPKWREMLKEWTRKMADELEKERR